jgi:hypothetical protein
MQVPDIRIGMVLQVEQSMSATGFVRVIGIDNSTPHPAAVHSHWNYIAVEHNPDNSQQDGKELRITRDALMSAVIRNFVDVSPKFVYNKPDAT